MKKILSLILALLMFTLVFAGCKKTEPVDVSDSETKLEEVTKAQAPTEAATKKAVDEKQAVVEAAKEKLNDAQKFFYDFSNLAYDENVFLAGEKSPYPDVPKYYLLKDYKTVEEFKNKALSLYSREEAYDNFFKYSENEEDYKLSGGPFMIEVDGRAYADVKRFGIGGGNVYDIDSIRIDEIEGDEAEIKVDYYFDREPENIMTEEFEMVKENGQWVFDDIVR